MVPSVIRRDPRRLPPYCVRQQLPRTNCVLSDATSDANATCSADTDHHHEPRSSLANNNIEASNSTQHQHRSSCSSSSNSPEFYIRGVVIGGGARGGKLKEEPSIDDPYRQPIDSRAARRQRFCAAHAWRRRSREGEPDDGCCGDDDDDDIDDGIDDSAQRQTDSGRIDALLMLNMDGYEMDRFGRLPGNSSRTPTPMQRRRLTPDLGVDGEAARRSPRRPARTNTAPPARVPSPTTEQIIRIVFNK